MTFSARMKTSPRLAPTSRRLQVAGNDKVTPAQSAMTSAPLQLEVTTMPGRGVVPYQNTIDF